MSGAVAGGMVGFIRVWWDVKGYMNWLYSGNLGPCEPTEGSPKIF